MEESRALSIDCDAGWIVVYAAGSLRSAFTALGRRFELETGAPVRFEFGASGLLKDRIVAGEPAQVFASANTTHPRALVEASRATGVTMFARNRLCVLVGPTLPADADLLEAMLDPQVKLGTSTPASDPGGDYAWEMFRKAEAIRPGACDVLSRKALQLTGGPDSPRPPADRSVYGELVAAGKADVFLTYRTNAMIAVTEQPQLRLLDLPPELAVGAEYGVAVIEPATAGASRFVEYLCSPGGRRTLQSFGFQ